MFQDLISVCKRNILKTIQEENIENEEKKKEFQPLNSFVAVLYAEASTGGQGIFIIFLAHSLRYSLIVFDTVF